ncbi:sirohydrochlorin chelatase [Actinotalea sp. K2]|uniref:sirohydrochlorin chelatase n=1 Tax=Actinotalea sp. K2 TaxID=2939438 RepID=UPI002016D8AB|nr:CbiX/SirB N-terminal domain-containing protein [Actinotalea sp. K2]MCL3861620.1 sirohydrochlorin chelatase [Actinotalea sp. K2]
MTTAPVLVACSHGTRDPAGRATIHALLEGIARARPDLDVREAFVDVQEPEVADVVAQAQRELRPEPGAASGAGAGGDEATEVVVVPLLLSAGFHVHVDIAAAVQDVRAVATGPLGPDPRLAEILADRLAEAGATDDDAVVLAAAGSSDARAAADVEQVVARLQAGRRGPVSIGYGSASHPRVPVAVAAAREAGARRVVVASYLLAPGYFHDRLAEAGADLVTAPLGPDPRLVQIAVDRYEAALRS